MYEVYLEQAAQKDLRRLPVDVFRRVMPVIETLAEDPRPRGCRKIHGSKSDWRIRIGSYRIIYEIDDKSQIVRIFRVRYRKEAYR
ncbi:MAG: type II toxin-antitoxin system RelE/ParE family toxin [Deltaproteobacteria bacterium]|nr:type II toxin-antitoxin system RelE/ParE family toxin [Deltaproteobacteria bacterium]